MENLAVITALYHSRAFRNHLLGFRKKNKKVIHQPRSVRIGKNCAFCLVYRWRYPRPWLVNNLYTYIIYLNKVMIRAAFRWCDANESIFSFLRSFESCSVCSFSDYFRNSSRSFTCLLHLSTAYVNAFLFVFCRRMLLAWRNRFRLWRHRYKKKTPNCYPLRRELNIWKRR